MSVAIDVEPSRHSALTLRCISAVSVLSILLLAGCATTETQPALPPPQPVAPPTTQVFVYPTSGQTAAQLDRDRYECHIWAVNSSGFDPSERQVAPHQRVQVVSMPPSGANVAAGAITGATLGAIISNPGSAAGGAIFGAVAGAALGAASDSAHQQQVSAAQRSNDQRNAQVTAARLEQQASGYRRALSACLEGRGYTVK